MKELRINELADFIERNKTVSLKQLSEHFKVSIFTIRRDINELLEKNIIVKHYGGVSINQNIQPLVVFEDRNTINKEEKAKISKLASQFIHDNDIIFLDSGTTTMYLADYILDKKITVITHSVHIIKKLLDVENIKLIILGGELDYRTNSLVGYQTIEYLKRLNINKSFLGSSGVTLDSSGLTNFTAIEADISKACIENSQQNYLLVDSTKFDRISLITYGKLSDIHTVITDQLPSEKYCQYFKEHKINIIYQ